MGGGGRQGILNFPYIPVFFTTGSRSYLFTRSLFFFFSLSLENYCAILREFSYLPVPATSVNPPNCHVFVRRVLLRPRRTEYKIAAISQCEIFTTSGVVDLLPANIIRVDITSLTSGESYKCFLLLQFILRSL